MFTLSGKSSSKEFARLSLLDLNKERSGKSTHQVIINLIDVKLHQIRLYWVLLTSIYKFLHQWNSESTTSTVSTVQRLLVLTATLYSHPPKYQGNLSNTQEESKYPLTAFGNNNGYFIICKHSYSTIHPCTYFNFLHEIGASRNIGQGNKDHRIHCSS